MRGEVEARVFRTHLLAADDQPRRAPSGLRSFLWPAEEEGEPPPLAFQLCFSGALPCTDRVRLVRLSFGRVSPRRRCGPVCSAGESPVLDPGWLLRAVHALVILLVAELALVEPAVRAVVVADGLGVAGAVPAPAEGEAHLLLPFLRTLAAAAATVVAAAAMASLPAVLDDCLGLFHEVLLLALEVRLGGSGQSSSRPPPPP